MLPSRQVRQQRPFKAWVLETRNDKKSLIHKFSTIMFMLESTLYKYMVWHTSVIGVRTFGCFLSDDCYLDEVSGVNKKWLAAVIWGHVTLVRPARPRAHMLLWLAWRGGEGGTKPLLLLLQSVEATPLARAQSTRYKDERERTLKGKKQTKSIHTFLSVAYHHSSESFYSISLNLNFVHLFLMWSYVCFWSMSLIIS